MNITVKDVPKELHERLKSVAEETGRSLNKLILVTLERALMPRKTDRHRLLQRIQERRATMGAVLDDSGLSQAIEEGRE
jgi:fructose-1,6-bisphosphatase/sedoheptulose 1,7-bisphosphatase-like protein